MVRGVLVARVVGVCVSVVVSIVVMGGFVMSMAVVGGDVAVVIGCAVCVAALGGGGVIDADIVADGFGVTGAGDAD